MVNAFLTIYLAGKVREIGQLFITGLMMVLLGSVTVLWAAPQKERSAEVMKMPAAAAPAVGSTAAAETPAAEAPPRRSAVQQAGSAVTMLTLQMLSIAVTAISWGSYGVTLHKGQAAMGASRLRPFLCVGLAYFAIAVVIPFIILAVRPEASEFNLSGTSWSLAAGAAGAAGALGIIMAFNFGGKPVFVMPLVYGGAPVVATLVSTAVAGLWDQIGPLFLAGLILLIGGAVTVLVFAPKGPAPAPAKEAPKKVEAPKQDEGGGEGR